MSYYDTFQWLQAASVDQKSFAMAGAREGHKIGEHGPAKLAAERPIAVRAALVRDMRGPKST